MLDRPTANPRPVLAASLATLALFAAHHVYGAVRYGTPWRHHAAVIAVAAGAALVAASRVYRRRPDSGAGRVAAWALVALVVLLLGGGVGLFEGLYNHAVKDVLWLGGAPAPFLRRLFPPPRYELPNDVVFEISGVLQAVAAAVASARALRLARSLRGRGPVDPGSGNRRPERLAPGATFPARTVETVSGRSVRIPDPALLTHVQLRRWPILRAVAVGAIAVPPLTPVEPRA